MIDGLPHCEFWKTARKGLAPLTVSEIRILWNLKAIVRSGRSLPLASHGLNSPAEELPTKGLQKYDGIRLGGY